MAAHGNKWFLRRTVNPCELGAQLGVEIPEQPEA